jgi:DNA-binding transcriptional MerR regulator
MAMQYRIGEFAELAGVSSKTLRHYDRLGLLRPVAVDARTRYRCYSSAQLRELSTILALRELGLSLPQIRSFVQRTGRMSHADRRTLLLRIRQNLQHTIQSATRPLTDVDAALNREIDISGAWTGPVSVVMRRRPGMRIASLRAEMEGYVEADVVRLERELLTALPSEFIGAIRGVLWQRRPDSDTLIAEPFFEVNHALPRRSFYELKDLPPVMAASTYCDNDDYAASEAYQAINSWMSARDLSLGGPKRELCFGDMLEIQAPLTGF